MRSLSALAGGLCTGGGDLASGSWRARVSAAVLTLVLAPSETWAWPSRQAGTIEDAAATGGLCASEDGRLLAAVSRDGAVRVWDRWGLSATPSALSLSGCGSASAVVFVDDDVLDERLIVACEAGILAVVSVERGVLSAELQREDDVVVFEAGGDLVALSFVPGEDVVHVVEQDGAYGRLAAVGTDGDVLVAAGLPMSFSGTATGLASSADGTGLLLGRSTGAAIHITRSTAGYTASERIISLLGGLDDVAGGVEAPFFVTSDPTQDSLWWVPANGDSTSGGLFADDVSGPKPVAWAPNSGGPVLLAGLDTGVIGFFDDEGNPVGSVETTLGSIGSFVPLGLDEPFFAASTAGAVGVFADGPFVRSLSASDTNLATGEVATVSFTVDGGGEFTVRASGEGDPGSGTVLATGTAVDADPAEVLVAAEDLPVEGANALFVEVENTEGSTVDGLVLVVDLPPPAVTGFSAGAADGAAVLAWDVGEAGDLVGWDLFLSDVPFDTSEEPDYELGEGEDAQSFPRRVDIEAGVDRPAARIEGLTNGLTYWVAIRAVDASGQEGPLVTPLLVQPEPTCSAAECAGDTGGCTCGAAPVAGPSPIVALVLGVLAIGVRRRPDLRSRP